MKIFYNHINITIMFMKPETDMNLRDCGIFTLDFLMARNIKNMSCETWQHICGLSRKYPAILNISSTGPVALM